MLLVYCHANAVGVLSRSSCWQPVPAGRKQADGEQDIAQRAQTRTRRRATVAWRSYLHSRVVKLQLIANAERLGHLLPLLRTAVLVASPGHQCMPLAAGNHVEQGALLVGSVVFGQLPSSWYRMLTSAV